MTFKEKRLKLHQRKINRKTEMSVCAQEIESGQQKTASKRIVDLSDQELADLFSDSDGEQENKEVENEIFIHYTDGSFDYISCFSEMKKKNIWAIVCDKMKIMHLPIDISKYLEHCYVFVIARCLLRELPMDLKLPNCTKFHVYHNLLKELPPDLQLYKCEDFDVSHNFLEHMPPLMGLTSCRYYNASFNHLRNFPTKCDLVSCEKFDISRNLIEALGTSWEPFVLPNCKHFDISVNKITSFPTVFELPACEKFLAFYNSLQSLAGTFSLPECVYMNLAGNMIESIPLHVKFPKCRSFILTDNNLTLLPNHSQIPNVERLIVPVNNLQELPGWILEAKQLREIDVKGNKSLVWTPEMIDIISKCPSKNAKGQINHRLFDVMRQSFNENKAERIAEEKKKITFSWMLSSSLVEIFKKNASEFKKVKNFETGACETLHVTKIQDAQA